MSNQDAGQVSPAKTLLHNESETAKMLAISRALLRKWRRQKSHLPFVRLGSRVLYRGGDIAEFVRVLGGESQV